VTHADGYAKIELGALNVRNNTLKPKRLREALKIARNHNAYFERKWDEFFRW
jgi:hypothetical protein